MKRPIGLAALTVLELSPAEQISVAADAGYDFVGLRLIPVAGQQLAHRVYGCFFSFGKMIQIDEC